jgi:glutamate-ammonia-ligase adenylyltransferase
VAEAIVTQVARDQWQRRAARYGTPMRASDGARDRWAILALGKLGGRELNYHSDLDLAFLHQEPGMTTGPGQAVPNVQFVTEVAQRVLKALAGDRSTGPLYRVDARLRPHGSSGPLVVTLDAFEQYFETSAQTWERMALTRARVIFATGGFGRDVAERLRAILARPQGAATLAAGVLAMRRRVEASRARSHLKRGAGGLADIEFLVQYLMLSQSERLPELLRPNLWDALGALHHARILPSTIYNDLVDAYSYLRTVEGRLRLHHNRACSELPTREADLIGLARRLYDADHAPDAALRALRTDIARHTARTRAIFEQFVGPLERGE